MGVLRTRPYSPRTVAGWLWRQPLRSELTTREKKVLALMAEGRSNQAIAERLGITVKTVETYVRSIFSKLELRPTPDDHRRVVAVLTYLRARAGSSPEDPDAGVPSEDAGTGDRRA